MNSIWKEKQCNGCLRRGGKIKLHFDNEDDDRKDRKLSSKHIQIRTDGNK